MLEQYLKNQDKLTIFTENELLQKQYDEIKQNAGAEFPEFKRIVEENAQLRKSILEVQEKTEKQLQSFENEVIKLLRGEKDDLPGHVKIMGFCVG